MQVFRTTADFTYFRSMWFMCQGRTHFHEQFLPVWMVLKNAIKSSIIALDSYTIPDLKANMSWYAFASRQRLFLGEESREVLRQSPISRSVL